MITEEAIQRAASILAETARAPAKVILFGSYVRGDAGPHSDLDFLVIERQVDSRSEEMVRLRRALPFLGVGIDVIVVTEDYAEYWGDTRGTVVHAALSEGKVIAES